MPNQRPPPPQKPSASSPGRKRSRGKRIALWTAGVLAGGLFAGTLATGVGLAMIWRELPDVSALADYQPKLPMVVYTADGVRIGEFGREHRVFVPIDAIPEDMQNAVIAVEDSRFREHDGIDVIGIGRAALANMEHGLRQGASTITMQVARNMYLSSERTLMRKVSEALLAVKLERQLTKQQILEIYLNHIYLGQGAWGFEAASQTYFGHPLSKITLAEAAMLAGLPKAPSANNPVVNPRRARARQLYVLERMQQLGMIDSDRAIAATAEPLQLRKDSDDAPSLQAAYVAEAVRQQMVARYGAEATTRGLKVYTTLIASEQQAAVASLHKGLLDYALRQPWRGPEATAPLPDDPKEETLAIDDALADVADDDVLPAAVVLKASAKEVVARNADGETLTITGKGLRRVQSALLAKAPDDLRIVRGAVIRVMRSPQGEWEIAQWPDVQGALVALDPQGGEVRALVGGFDFGASPFNRVTQAWRQPGSSFKPFIYSAALEHGLMPGSVVEDAPLSIERAGGPPWEPKNYEPGFSGPMTLRSALAHSKNTVMVRVLQAIGVATGRDWIGRFGFDRDKQPAYLPLALGTGAVTPLQMAAGYAVFANGGYRVNPILVARVTDDSGQVLFQASPTAPSEATRAIPARNAFVMNTMLHSVMTEGTGQKAWQTLGRRADLYGKTGTTNDSFDAWFAGYQPSRVAVAWVGYDTPRQLGEGGRGETGASAAMPIWSGYMQAALRGVPVAPLASPPEGVSDVQGDWAYNEVASDAMALAALGHSPDATVTASADPLAGLQSELPSDAPRVIPAGASGGERNRILDMFR